MSLSSGHTVDWKTNCVYKCFVYTIDDAEPGLQNIRENIKGGIKLA